MGKIKKLIAFLMLLVFIVNDNTYGMKNKKDQPNNNITLIERIKDLPYFEIFIYGGKVFSSLAHSIVNGFYEIETLHMNSPYSLKKYLCWGYMFQPAIMSPFSFLDFNVNILGGIIDSAIFVLLSLSKEHINTLTKGFYIFTSPFNINLNLKITKDFYIAINLTGILRAVALLFLIKNKNINGEREENDNPANIDNVNNSLNDVFNVDNKPNDNNNLNDSLNNNVNVDNNPENNNPNDDLNNNFNVDNNQENNDKWEKIKKEKKISEEKDDNKIQEMYNQLKDDFNDHDIFNDEAEIKKAIIENNFDYDKVVEILHAKLSN